MTCRQFLQIFFFSVIYYLQKTNTIEHIYLEIRNPVVDRPGKIGDVVPLHELPHALTYDLLAETGLVPCVGGQGDEGGRAAGGGAGL